ncbi:MAG: hypothetical protein HY327_07840 [Chloroflexi bacterium]|nr:hypothetical protein [Chloroflexota bacterium]
MISPSMQDALNGQIRAEIYSSRLYLSLAADCYSLNRIGNPQSAIGDPSSAI